MSNRLNTGKKRNSSAGLAKEAIAEIQKRITGIYVLAMFGVFPLFVRDYYFNILKEKFYFFFYSTILCAAICVIAGLVGVFGGSHAKKSNSGDRKTFFRKIASLAAGLWNRLSLTDRFFYGFILVAGISTAFSAWPYQSFWGNMGRYQGFLFYLTAAAAYAMVRKHYVFKNSHLYVLLIAGALVSLWGVTDYLGLDLLHFRRNMNISAIDALPFSSSIGNVNTLTGLLALYLGATAVLCISSEKWYLVFPALFVFSIGLISGTSDNAVLSVACVYAVTPFFAFYTRKGMVRYLFMVAVFCLAMGFIGRLTAWMEPVTTTASSYPWMVGLLLKFSLQYDKAFLAAAAILAAAGLVLKKVWAGSETKGTGPARILWAVLCGLTAAVMTVVLVLANTGRLPEALSPYKDILVFSDSWGTNRGYAWKRLFEVFHEFPFHKKLFGSGPETYAIFMAKNYYYDMQQKIGQVFDSPHSEPLQYLFTTGILGFVTYYGAVAAGCIRGMRTGGTARIFAFAVIAYTAASLINISVPITTPLVFLSLAIAGSIKESEEDS